MSVRSDVEYTPLRKPICGTSPLMACAMSPGLLGASSGPPDGGKPWQVMQVWWYSVLPWVTFWARAGAATNTSRARAVERTITVGSHFFRPADGPRIVNSLVFRAIPIQSVTSPSGDANGLGARALRCMDRAGRFMAGAAGLIPSLSPVAAPRPRACGSREANDLAQILFALYVGVALTAATREHSHLAADVLAKRYTGKAREWMWRIACVVIAIPSSIYVMASAAGATWLSIAQLEHFPETMNPGYFVVRIAAFLLAALVLAQALLDLFGRRERR